MKTYLSEICHGDDLDRDLNHYAKEGWRLVSLVYLDMGNYRYVFESSTDDTYTEGVMADGAAILKDGVPLTITQVLEILNGHNPQ